MSTHTDFYQGIFEEGREEGLNQIKNYISDLEYALKGLAAHELGETFGEDAGLCWYAPFYRGESWPGHDEACTWIRKLLNE